MLKIVKWIMAGLRPNFATVRYTCLFVVTTNRYTANFDDQGNE